MNANLKYNLLKRLNNKEKGFTLIELLVVIIIIGILSAIALPAFLNQAAKARQSEAKTTVGSINRGQQAYYLEQSKFASTLNILGLGVASSTNNFYYGSVSNVTGTGYTNAALAQISNQDVAHVSGAGITDQIDYAATLYAVAVDPAVKHYTGTAYITTDSDGNGTTRTILCEAISPRVAGSASLPAVEFSNATPEEASCVAADGVEL